MRRLITMRTLSIALVLGLLAIVAPATASAATKSAVKKTPAARATPKHARVKTKKLPGVKHASADRKLMQPKW